MLSPTMVDKINAQLNCELYSSHLYLQMSAWCTSKGFEGASKFFQSQSREEMDHMYRMFDYLSRTTMPILNSLEAPKVTCSFLLDVFNRAYEHEQMITNKINDLVTTAMELRDYVTFHFLEWYVEEQHEEEKLFQSILDQFTLVNTNENGLFLIDQELKKRSQD